MADRRFDGETGLLTEDALLRQLRMDTDLLVKEAVALSAMSKTAGWQVVQRFLNECIADYHGKLLDLRDLDEIRRAQERVKAYAGVLSYVEVVVREGEEAQEAAKQEFETAPEETDPDSGLADQDNP
jgi:hypothetical protein